MYAELAHFFSCFFRKNFCERVAAGEAGKAKDKYYFSNDAAMVF
jgi:hypothetical protein